LSRLTAAQLHALRALRSAYPDAEIAMIGAAALAFHIDMAWRTSIDLDLVIAVAVADLDPSRLPGWRRHPKLEHSWRTDQGVLVDLVPAPSDALDFGELVWPASGHRMNLTGVRQAFQSSKVQLEVDLSIAVASVPAITIMKMSAFVDRPYEREKDLKDLAHILDDYPSLDDDGLFSDEVRAMGLELGAARGFVLGCRVRDIASERDCDVIDAFFRKVEEDVHWTRFVDNSPWRHDEDELRSRRDGLRSGFVRNTLSIRQ
jgi:predicted nucleotidyltransferase